VSGWQGVHGTGGPHSKGVLLPLLLLLLPLLLLLLLLLLLPPYSQ